MATRRLGRTSDMQDTLATTEATIRVVDDDPAFRKSLRWLLESAGLNVRTFASAPEFLKDDDPDRPGCLLLDLRMPGMGGLELQQQLRQSGTHIPVIIITAHGDVPTAVRAMKSGALDFIEKPLSDQHLLDRIGRAVDADVERRERLVEQSELDRKRNRLTAREREVMELVVLGRSSREIGEDLGVSFKTIAAHRSKIMSKMGASSVPQLIQMNLADR